MKYLYYYLIAINFLAVIIMAVDKHYAIRKKWRIPEKTLLLTAAFGGSPGLWLAMYTIRHKNRKKKFYLGVPAILLFQILAVYFVVFYPK